jgi:outer membrane protein assembly factor BamB
MILQAACGGSTLRVAPRPPMAFPLIEEARISCQGPLLPHLVEGPEGLLLLTTKTGRLQALDVEKRAVRWTFSASAASVTPVVAGDRVIFAAADGTLYGIDSTGKTVWERKLEDPVRGELMLAGSQLIYRADQDALVSLNAADGSRRWRIPSDVRTDPSIWGDRFVYGTTDGKLRVVDTEGRKVRNWPLGEAAVGRPFIHGDRAFVSFEDGRFEAFDLPTGKKRWSIRLGGIPIAPPVFDGRNLFVVLSTHIVAAIRAKRGDLLWWHPLSGRAAFPPLLENNALIVASRSPILQAFAGRSLTPTTAFEADREIATTLLIRGGILCLGLNGETEGTGTVVMLRLEPPALENKTTPGTRGEGDLR